MKDFEKIKIEFQTIMLSVVGSNVFHKILLLSWYLIYCGQKIVHSYMENEVMKIILPLFCFNSGKKAFVKRTAPR